MRPHRLRFAGIGPYPAPVEIDFDELGTLGLYLIVGPTGAGKTTIFDAITFALYGEVAGTRQSAITGFVSDHPFAGEPFVELEFSHRDTRYRVRRRPRDEEHTTRPADHRLVELADGGEGAALTGTREVNARIKDVLGLDAKQFKHVVLIPQNEFQDFLVAGEREKEEILRALFDTALYDRIARRLQDIAKEVRQQSDALAAELAVSEGVAANALAQLAEDGLLPERAEGDEAPAGAAALAEVEALAAAAEAERAAAAGRLEAAARARADAAREAERFDAAAQLASARAEAEREAAADAAAAAEAALHERAAQVAGPARAAAAAAARARALAGAAEEAQAVLAALLAGEARPLAVLAPLVALPAGTPPEQLRAELARLAEALGRARALYAEAEADARAVAAARTAQEKAVREIAAAGDAVAAIDTELTAHHAETSRLLALAAGLLDAQRAVDALDAALAAAAVSPAREAHERAEEELARLAGQLAAVDERLAEARAALDAEHAGRLATALVPGEPCPVCGALDHPHPAPRSPEAAAVDAVEAEHRAATNAVLAARQAASATESALAAALAAEAALPPAEEQAARRARLAEAEAAQSVQAARAAAATALSQRRDEATQAAAAARTAEAQARSTIEATEPARLRKLEQAAQIVATAELDPALAVVAAAREAVDRLASAADELAGAQAAAREAEAALAAVLEATGFATADAAASATLPADALAACRARIAAADERAGRIQRLTGAAGDPATVPSARPDVDALAEAATLAEHAQREAVRRSEALGLARRTLADVAATLAEKGPVAAEARGRAEQAAELAGVFKNGSTSALPLERWVLRAFFEEVCAVATVRLEQLSRGRYRLALDNRAAGRKGLAIVVFDAHTGKSRPVELLSGGEKFLASLALALGLADVVQSQSGGIDLSAMFIDEGFGSLDQETLDVAIDVLRDLLDSGRTIGVITHVEAMKQELPVGLEIVRGTGGSSVRTGAALASS